MSSASKTPVQAMALSDATRARFAREVAKFPADQKQSAVMACLSILQQEQGWVSPEGELAVAEVLGMPVMEAGCAAWMECRLIREPHAEDAYDTCFAEVVSAAADPRVFDGPNVLM